MATDYIVKLTGQDNLTPTIKNVQSALNQVASNSSNLDKISERFNKIDASSAPLKKKLKDIQMLMAEMNLNGDSNSPIYTQMAEAAGRYKDAISDASAATQRFASDTMNLEAGIAALQGIASVGSIAAGVMGLLGTENEKVTQAILKVQSAIAILNGVQTLANILNKDSVLIQKAKQIANAISIAQTETDTVATTANTVATNVNTAANKTSTIAQNAWNVAKAIGKALMGDFTGLLIVGAGALVTYALCTQDSSEATEKNNEVLSEGEIRLNAVREATEELSKATNEKIGESIGQFESLKAEWQALQTTAEKTAAFEKFKSSMERLGFAVENVNDLERIFNARTGAIIKAFEARAQAAAAQEGIVKAWKDYYEDLNKLDNVAGGKWFYTVKEGETFTGYSEDKQKELNEWWVKTINEVGEKEFFEKYMDGSGLVAKFKPMGVASFGAYSSNKAAERYKKNSADAATRRDQKTKIYYQALEESEQKLREIEKELKAQGIDYSRNRNAGGSSNHGIGSGNGSGSGNNSHNNQRDNLDPNSLAYLEKKLTDVKNKLREVNPATEQYNKLLEEQKTVEKQIQAKKVELIVNAKLDNEELIQYQNQLKELKIDINDDEVMKKANKLVRKFEDTKFLVDLHAEMDNSMGGISTEISKIEEMIRTADVEDIEFIEKLIKRKKELEKELEELQIQFGLLPKIDPFSEIDIQNKLSEAIQEFGQLDENIHPERYKELCTYINELNRLYERLAFNKANALSNVSIGNELDSIYFVKGSKEDKRASLLNANQIIQKYQSDYKLNIIGYDEFKSKVDEITELIHQLDENLELDLRISAKEDFESFLQGLGGSVTTMVDQFMMLGNAINENIGNSTLYAAAGLTILGDSLQQLGQDGIAGKIGAVMAAVGQIILGFATASAQAAALGPLGWLAFVGAGLATVAATVATIQKFADGGIIQGATHHGDNILARVNAGEMILNKKQQSNLFRILDNGSTGQSGAVISEVKIKGSDLYLALKNYNGKMSKIR